MLAHPELVVNRLLDHPIDAVYVQPLRLDATRDSVEKLVQYLRFLRAIRREVRQTASVASVSVAD